MSPLLNFYSCWPFTQHCCLQEQGAASIVYCACHPSMSGISGLYMHECWPVEPSPEAQDPSTASALWELCEDIVQEKMAQDAESDSHFS